MEPSVPIVSSGGSPSFSLGKPMARVLIVAGSDPSGGAGIQADIKTVTMFGQYAAAAITALTVQNTLGVKEAVGVEPRIIEDQIVAVLEDVGADAVKTGMLHSAEVVAAVADTLVAIKFGGPIVVDPVMVASSGDRLLDDTAVALIRDRLIPLATLVTPNLPEAEVLTGLKVTTPDEMEKAGHAILAMGAPAVLMKGGHLNADELTDLLITKDKTVALSTAKIETRHTHGTGCTYASAFASLLAAGHNLEQAFPLAHTFVQEAITAAPQLGAGHGPLGHARVRVQNDG